MIGQDCAPVLPSVKFAEIAGLLPLLGTGRFRVAFPTFSTVIVCGLSLLVEPGVVLAKFKIGGSAKSSFNMRSFPASAI
jgi:hypothetical protein